MTGLDPPCVFFNVVVTVESAPRTLVSTPVVVGSLERFPLPATAAVIKGRPGLRRTAVTMDDFDFRRIPVRRTASIPINSGCDGRTNGGHSGRLRFSANGGHDRRINGLDSWRTAAATTDDLDSDERWCRLRTNDERRPRRTQRTTSILGERRARQTDERSRLLANSGGHDGRPRF
ncbi:conserved hypothetical protein [Coccidioides posadasii str. Silveira]|uniref:Uncharacterized protein n=2 Tax=Coccidioides posadasii TaxID=199306 RepID=E9D9G9_COCPS|nr:conserved hypothetical protein [Coccidioides posadasii str. Silveira]KMM70112.1 hypothetical protein CPAG_06424 [Coccidioides posadasii RMSCC 3488]